MNKDNSVNELAQTKIWADSEKYFSLFDRHVPSLGKGRTVLLYSIDNVDCILKIAAKNPDASYVVYGNPLVNRMVEGLLPGASTIDETFENRKAYNIDMNFDCVIMNPPYDKNLHLKILAEAIKHLKDDESVCVNLSPVRWLQDPLAKYKKNSDYHRFEESVSKHMTDLTVYASKDAETFFGGESHVCFKIDLGVYTAGKSKNNKYNYSLFSNSIVDKVAQSSACGIPVQIIGNIASGNFCILNDILGNHDGVPGFNNYMPLVKTVSTYGKYYFNGLSEKNNKTVFQNKAENTRSVNGNPNNWSAVELNSAVELENFYNFTTTEFFKYVFCASLVDVHVHHKYLPWMGEAVNPRTGLKGYQSEWIDEDLYKFFGITDDEKKIIEETMAKYAKK